jgi:hypothetical protein
MQSARYTVHGEPGGEQGGIVFPDCAPALERIVLHLHRVSRALHFWRLPSSDESAIPRPEFACAGGTWGKPDCGTILVRG